MKELALQVVKLPTNSVVKSGGGGGGVRRFHLKGPTEKILNVLTQDL